MAKVETNKAPWKIIVDGTGPRDSIVAVDLVSETETFLAALSVLDRNTLPAFTDNVISVADSRFEIHDGNLYLSAGEQLPAGEFELKLTATDAYDPTLTKTQKVIFNVTAKPFSIAGDTLVLNYDGAAAITRNSDGGWHVALGIYGMDLTAEEVATIANVQLHGANALDIAGDALDAKAFNVLTAGAGDSLNISGVVMTESSGGVSVGSNVDISHLSTSLDLLVNGSRAEAFIATWNYLDDAYAWLATHGGNLWGGYTDATPLPDGMVILGQTQLGAAALATNMAVAQLDIDYANYLADGGSALELSNFTAKTNAAGTREQTIHDNLLGAISQYGITDRNFADDVEAAFLAQIPEGFITRPYASGALDAYGRNDAGTNLAKAWDFARGFDRVDYETHFTGPIDASGTKTDGTMLFGSGNPSTGYTIAIHDGSGVEFGFNVHYRTGDQISGQLEADGLVHFDAPAGHQTGYEHNVQGDNVSRSATSVDYALITGLNGTHLEITDYVVKLLIDLDPSAAAIYKTFTMVDYGVGINYFVADEGLGGFGDTNAMRLTVAEDSINFGYSFLADPLNANPGDLAAGTYDIVAEVWDASGTVQLVGNHIVLDVA